MNVVRNIAAVLLILSAISGEGEAQKSCNQLYFTNNCCDGQTFRLGHINYTLMAECDVPPKDETLALVPSAWLAYGCLVRKILGATPFSRENYVKMMLKDLPAQKQNQILKRMTEVETDAEVHTTYEQHLRAYWEELLKALHTECSSSDAAQKRNMTLETVLRYRKWEDVKLCGGEFMPKIVFKVGLSVHNETVKKVEACKEKFPNSLDHDVDVIEMGRMCAYVLHGLIDISAFEKDDMDYVEQLKLWLPQFFSKSSLNKALNIFHTYAKAHVQTNASDRDYLEQFKREQQSIFKSKVAKWQKQGHEVSASAFLLNSYVYMKLKRVLFSALTHVCF